MLDQVLSTLNSAKDLLLVVLGFSLIIVFHELGHFLAARWAGIRVLAFAVGFGPAFFSFRKGMGWRRGSSEAEYNRLMKARAMSVIPPPLPPADISTTEYRLNVLPFGGYVKMLGQDDADPSARSDAPDSYQSCKVWKRMIVISAGVVMNLLMAAILFVVVFMVGLKVEPAKVGYVAPNLPAGKAIANNAKELGVTEPGLQTGDLVLKVNGKRPANFNDLVIASAMARGGDTMRLEVERKGIAKPLIFDIEPKKDDTTKMLQLGIGPAASAMVNEVKDPVQAALFEKFFVDVGIVNVKPGAKLVQVGDDTNIESVYELSSAAAKSGGQPIPVVFENQDAANKGTRASGTVLPVREMQRQLFRTEADRPPSYVPHVLGLLPVMKVLDVNAGAEKVGLKAGDIFEQIGDVEWPSLAEGMAEIRKNKGGTVQIVVLRTENGTPREVKLDSVPVDREGRIGFYTADTSRDSARITAWPQRLAVSTASLNDDEKSDTDAIDRAVPVPSITSLNLFRGSTITKIGDKPVSNFNDIVNALATATDAAHAAGNTAEVELTVLLPVKGESEEKTVKWTLTSDEVASLHQLAWLSPVEPGWFEPETFIQKSSNPVEAIGEGILQTKSVMMSTYVTFIRLFEGSVKVEHLKGPVGIAHVGTIVASKGFVWLLFFLALISVNLAVVNFLPIPIADGGQFIFLLYEQIMGKPVSVAVQNAAALMGLALVVGMFLLVTYNDISNLIGR